MERVTDNGTGAHDSKAIAGNRKKIMTAILKIAPRSSPVRIRRMQAKAFALVVLAFCSPVHALLVAKPSVIPARLSASSSSRQSTTVTAAIPTSPYSAGDACGHGRAVARSSELQARLARPGGSVTRAEALSGIFAGIISTVAVATDISRARATDDGLGVVDDLLADCPSTPTCVSSQDDRPYPFMEPWTYEGPWEKAMDKLRTHLEFDGAKVVAASPRYLRVEFDAKQALSASVDDAEFYFTPGDALVQFRCARRTGPTDFGANRRRMDGIRVALNFESVPVLRNRKRAFFFGESPLDSFGPSFGKVDPSVIYGDADPMSPPFETPSGAMREHNGASSDKPAWWGKPLAEAGGFGADWRQSPNLLWLTTG